MRHFFQRIILCLLCCGILNGAELSPLTVNKWYRQLIVDRLVEPYFSRVADADIESIRAGAFAGYVSSIRTPSPAQDHGLLVGDAIVGVNGWHCIGFDEFDLLNENRMPGEDACTLQVLRDGELQTIPITGMTVRDRIGFNTHRRAYYIFPDLMPDDRPPSFKSGVALLGLGQGLVMRPEDDLLLDSIPDRRVYDLAQFIRSGASIEWLVPWIRWYALQVTEQFTAAEEIYQESLQKIPLESWQVMTDFIRAVGRAEGTGQYNWSQLGVSPTYGLLHYPFPHVIPPVGEEAWTDHILAHMVQSFSSSGHALRYERRILLSDAESLAHFSDADHFIQSILFAIGDKKSHGGWPYRHQNISSAKSARQTAGKIEAKLAAINKGDEEALFDPILIQSAAVLASTFGEQWDAAERHMQAVVQASPFLASWLNEMIVRGCEWQSRYKIRSVYLDRVARHLPTTDVHVAALADLWADQKLINSVGPLRYSRIADWYDRARSDRAKISRYMVGLGFLDDLMSEQFELQRTMNEASWTYATHPDLLNPKLAIQYALQLQLMGSTKIPAYIKDTVAAAYARNEDFEQAERWQRAAISGESRSSKNYNEFQQRLLDYQKGKKALDGESNRRVNKTWAGRDQTGELQASGHTLKDKAIGIWEFQQEGQVFVRGDYCYGKPNGWFQFYDQSGTLRMAGLLHTHKRGGVVPVGQWTYWRTDGSRHAAGTWSQGQAVGPWTFYHGKEEESTTLEFDGVPKDLPEIEPVPIGGFVLPQTRAHHHDDHPRLVAGDVPAWATALFVSKPPNGIYRLRSNDDGELFEGF